MSTQHCNEQRLIRRVRGEEAIAAAVKKLGMFRYGRIGF
jgi:hypothetical protein